MFLVIENESFNDLPLSVPVSLSLPVLSLPWLSGACRLLGVPSYLPLPPRPIRSERMRE